MQQSQRVHFSVDVLAQDTTVADWISAIGQAAGAVFTAAAVVVAVWIAIADSRRRDREQEDQQYGQARTVTATIEYQSRTALVWTGQDCLLAVNNHGSQPVTEVVIENVTCQGESNRVYSEWRLDMNGRNSHTNQSPYLITPALGPLTTSESRPLSFRDRTTEDRLLIAKSSVTFTFLDAHGMRWRRVGNGAPQRIAAADQSDHTTI